MDASQDGSMKGMNNAKVKHTGGLKTYGTRHKIAQACGSNPEMEYPGALREGVMQHPKGMETGGMRKHTIKRGE